MNSDDVTKIITCLFSKVAEDLWLCLEPPRPGKHGLVFPRYTTGRLCVTEQPASHLFGHHAANISEISYAPEAPTKGQNYGKKNRSSLSDWRLFDASTGEDRANIEFKAGTGGDVACYMRKLLRDGSDGAWFCTLGSGHKAAFNRIFDGLREALEKVLPPSGNTHSLTVAICALSPRELMLRSFKPGELTAQLAKAKFSDSKWRLGSPWVRNTRMI